MPNCRRLPISTLIPVLVGCSAINALGAPPPELPDWWDGPIFLPDILTVPAPYPTIQSAVDAATNGDIIVLESALIVENVEIDGKSLSIVSSVGTVLQPDSDAPIFDVSNTPDGGLVEFEGLTFNTYVIDEDGPITFALQDGHAIRGVSAKIELTKCTFGDCAAGTGILQNARTGGAVSLIGCDLYVDRCVFGQCDATYGGALGMWGGALSMEQSIFEGCWSEKGGALYLLSVDAEVSQCLFDDNDAADEGGHMNVKGGSMSCTRTVFRDGASMTAGAVSASQYVFFTYTEDPSMSLSKCRFENNVAMGAEDVIDVWEQDCGDLPSMANSSFCGSVECDGVYWGITTNWAMSCDGCDADTNKDWKVDVLDLVQVLTYWGEYDPLTDVWEDGAINGGDLFGVLMTFDCAYMELR